MLLNLESGFAEEAEEVFEEEDEEADALSGDRDDSIDRSGKASESNFEGLRCRLSGSDEIYSKKAVKKENIHELPL